MEKNITYGKRNVFQFIESIKVPSQAKLHIKEILIKEDAYDEERKIWSNSLLGVMVRPVSLGYLDKLCRGANHQGIVIIRQNQKSSGNWEDFKSNLLPEIGPLILLDRIQDPGNLGNILRTADAYGVSFVVMSDRDSSSLSAVVEKASAGAIHSIKIFRIANISQAIDLMKEKDYWIMAMDETGEENWEDLPDPRNLVLLLGNEGEGIKRILIEKSDYVKRIPMFGSVSSLNVTVATGIALDRILHRKF